MSNKTGDENVSRIEEDINELKSIMNLRTESGFAYSQKNTLELQKSIRNFLAEIEKKDKQIDLMAKRLNQAYFDEDKFCKWFEKIMGVQQRMDYGYVVDLIKQYFAGLVEKE